MRLRARSRLIAHGQAGAPGRAPLAVTPRVADVGWLAVTEKGDITSVSEPGTRGPGKGLAHLSSDVHLQFSLSISFQSGYSHVSY